MAEARVPARLLVVPDQAAAGLAERPAQLAAIRWAAATGPAQLVNQLLLAHRALSAPRAETGARALLGAGLKPTRPRSRSVVLIRRARPIGFNPR